MQTDHHQNRNVALIGAAQALRTWVHARRDSWANGDLAAFAPVHVLATEPAVAAVGAASPAVEIEMPSTAERPPAFDMAKTMAPVAAAGRVTMRIVSAAAARWRLVAGAAVTGAVIYGAVSYGPMAMSAARAQASRVGRQVSGLGSSPKEAAPAAPVSKTRPAVAKAAVKRSGRLQIDSNPSGAKVLVDGNERGVTPLTVDDLAIGNHTITLQGAEGSVERTVAVAADKTIQVNEAIYSGWVHLTSPIDLTMFEGGQHVRLDDSNQVLLPPGKHDLRFENRDYRFVETRTITVLPGDTTVVSVQPPRSTLSVTANTPAEVLVDGTLIGGTPLNAFALDLGVREIVVRNAFGERRTTVTVTVDPISLAIDFSKP